MEELKKEIMRIKVTTTYSDSQLNRQVTAGEILTLTPERGTLIVKAGYAQVISIETLFDEKKVEKKIAELEAKIKELSKDTAKPETINQKTKTIKK